MNVARSLSGVALLVGAITIGWWSWKWSDPPAAFADPDESTACVLAEPVLELGSYFEGEDVCARWRFVNLRSHPVRLVSNVPPCGACSMTVEHRGVVTRDFHRGRSLVVDGLGEATILLVVPAVMEGAKRRRAEVSVGVVTDDLGCELKGVAYYEVGDAIRASFAGRVGTRIGFRLTLKSRSHFALQPEGNGSDWILVETGVGEWGVLWRESCAAPILRLMRAGARTVSVDLRNVR